MQRYHGELSYYVNEALTKTNLATVEVHPIEASRQVPGMTAIISTRADASLRSFAKLRKCSITALANSAIYDWLKRKTP